jgi:hypothetical protein
MNQAARGAGYWRGDPAARVSSGSAARNICAIFVPIIIVSVPSKSTQKLICVII